MANTDVKIALLYDETQSLVDVVKKAMELRKSYAVVSLYRLKKKVGKQLVQLDKSGFDGFAIYDDEMVIKPFTQAE